MSYIVTLTHDYNAFRNLETEWTTLQNHSDAFGAALTWTWINVWLKHFYYLGELWLLEAREEESKKLIGIAPLFKTSVKPKYGLPYRQIEFIGASHYHENLDFIIEKGFEHKLIPLFLRTLFTHQKEWDVLHFSSLANEKTCEILLSTRTGWGRDENSEMISPFSALPSDPDTWMNSLSRNRRWKLRRYRKNLDEEFPNAWSLDLITTADKLNEVFEYLVKYHQAQWEAVDKPGAFNYKKWTGYYRELMYTLLEKGWLRLSCLYINEKPAAILFSYHYAERAYNQISGIDHDISKIPLGHVMTHHSIELAITEGVKEYFFMWGDEPYKYSFGADNRTLVAYDFVSNTRVRCQRSLIEILRMFKKRTMTLVSGRNGPPKEVVLVT